MAIERKNCQLWKVVWQFLFGGVVFELKPKCQDWSFFAKKRNIYTYNSKTTSSNKNCHTTFPSWQFLHSIAVCHIYVTFIHLEISWIPFQTVWISLKKIFFSKHLERNPTYLENYERYNNVTYGDQTAKLSALKLRKALFI